MGFLARLLFTLDRKEDSDRGNHVTLLLHKLLGVSMLAVAPDWNKMQTY